MSQFLILEQSASSDKRLQNKKQLRISSHFRDFIVGLASSFEFLSRVDDF